MQAQNVGASWPFAVIFAVFKHNVLAQTQSTQGNDTVNFIDACSLMSVWCVTAFRVHTMEYKYVLVVCFILNLAAGILPLLSSCVP